MPANPTIVRWVVKHVSLIGSTEGSFTRLRELVTRAHHCFSFTASGPALPASCGAKTSTPSRATFASTLSICLGFGLSDKPGTAPYSADLYVELITDFIREVSGYPVNIVASSLGAAYAIRVADEHPELIKAMVLNAPTGADKLNTRPGMAGAAFYGLLQSPVLGTSFYNVMASERGIRDYSRKHLFYDHHRVTDRLVANLYATSHQSGAQHAIAAFLSGYLNTDTRAAFSRLTQPVLLVWGKQDMTTPLENAFALLRTNPAARLEKFDYCRMLPEQEHPEKFNVLVRDSFLARSAAATRIVNQLSHRVIESSGH